MGRLTILLIQPIAELNQCIFKVTIDTIEVLIGLIFIHQSVEFYYL